MEEIRKIYACYNERTIRVYQAYNNEIADQAVNTGHFGDKFKIDRMTWIKPSFLWMMYRSGWAEKEGQERILAIDLKIEGFRAIIQSAVLSAYDKSIYESYEQWEGRKLHSDVRCQWDPDRDIYLQPMERRAIQLGIKGRMVHKYVNEWIDEITDITKQVHNLKTLLDTKQISQMELPDEREFILTEEEKTILGTYNISETT